MVVLVGHRNFRQRCRSNFCSDITNVPAKTALLPSSRTRSIRWRMAAFTISSAVGFIDTPSMRSGWCRILRRCFMTMHSLFAYTFTHTKCLRIRMFNHPLPQVVLTRQNSTSGSRLKLLSMFGARCLTSRADFIRRRTRIARARKGSSLSGRGRRSRRFWGRMRLRSFARFMM